MILDIFSKRQKRFRGDDPDVYSYDGLPEPLRVQIVQICFDTLGGLEERINPGTVRAYEFIAKTLRREYGVFSLDPGQREYLLEISNFLLKEKNCERALDAVELSFRMINLVSRDYPFLRRNDAAARADAAIEELNVRFRENRVGYQFVGEEIVRVDSELLHTEVVVPALSLLRAPAYAGAQEEFLKAHEHYRHGRHKDALTECLKAFESVMKIVCKKRSWPHNANATSKDLIKVVFEKGLVPNFWESHFSGMRSMLESGVPTARNRQAGHGQGSEIVEVPGHFVAFVLHMTASAIVFIVEAEKALS